MAFKIHILYEFVEGPWGGGNQFLKALREHFRKAGVYSEHPEDAGTILFNSHHCFKEVFELKKRYPSKILIHRIDGPISYGRGKDRVIDEIIFKSNELLTDGTIFQSDWCRTNNYNLGMKRSPYETVVMNAPDPAIFNLNGKKPFSKKKIRLIGVSWSPNIRKGFDIYKFLDEHLDFNKYEMTFVGSSPIEFKNTRWIKPVPTQEVARLLKEHDVCVNASKYEACPNALIEALHCGLPAVARNMGANLEILTKAVELFEDENDVIPAIEKVANNYNYYRQQIHLPSFAEVGQRYYEFAQRIYEDYLSGNYHPKQVNFLTTVKFTGMRIRMLRRGVLNKLQAVRKERSVLS